MSIYNINIPKMASVLTITLRRTVSTVLRSFPPIKQSSQCRRNCVLLPHKTATPISSSSTSNTKQWSANTSSTDSWTTSSGFQFCSLSANSIRGDSAHRRICRPLSVGVALGKKAELVTVHFINRDGEKLTVKARTGQNLLDVVVDNDLDIDGYGSCEGTLSCSTCHLIFSEELFNNLKKPSDEELDMLDLAYGQTDSSRLGCQVILTKEMDGVTLVVPQGVSDARDA